jgi:hypothetical protein
MSFSSAGAVNTSAQEHRNRILRTEMRRYKLLLCLLSLFVVTACSSSQNNGTSGGAQNESSTGGQTDASSKPPPADVVRVEAPKVEIKSGASADASIKLTIANGYHVNANPASFSYLIATEVQLQPGKDVTADKPVYPTALTKTFAFSKDPLSVYEGTVEIKIPLKADSKAAKGEQKLAARVRVQPCDDQTCFPPRTIETSIPVGIN